MSDEKMYDQWIAKRREVQASDELVDRVMAAVQDRPVERKSVVQLVERMNESRLMCWAACLAALFVGSLPFLFAAYAAQLIVY